MKVALVYPPSADPSAPYVAVPLLAAVLRRAGFEVLVIDANLEAWESLLVPAALGDFAGRVDERFATLNRRRALTHPEQRDYLALATARASAPLAAEIEAALGVFRDPRRFHDPAAYEHAYQVVKAAQSLISAAFAPLDLDFATYRTPFGLLTPDEVVRQAAPGREPFLPYFQQLGARLADAEVGLVGLSVAFPGQLQAAFSLGEVLRQLAPGTVIAGGGPAFTQLFSPLAGGDLSRALGPFDVVVVGEAEVAIVELAEAVARGARPRGLVRAALLNDLADVPLPDYDGLPLRRYLSPEPVLALDATRGCYHGRCAFCHYGLAARGTAPYRERPLSVVLDGLAGWRERYGAKVIFLSEDTIAHSTLERLATGLRSTGLRIATDLRPEPGLDGRRARVLADGGVLAVSLGIESADPRVLKRIDKRIDPGALGGVVDELAAVGIAVEAMVFTDFPGERFDEAMATVRFLAEHADSISHFMFGSFALVAGSRVAANPSRYGIEAFGVAGDELTRQLFFRERRPAKREDEARVVDQAIERLSRRWLLRPYPFAGSISTAHSLLWLAASGPGVFRRLADQPAPRSPRGTRTPSPLDLQRLGDRVATHEAEIWGQMIWSERAVSRERWQELADELPPLLLPRSRRV